MKTFSIPKIIFVSIVFAVLAVISILSFHRLSSLFDFRRSTELHSTDFLEERERWSRRIDEVGGQQAYEDFKQRYQLSDHKKQHVMIHLFGILLYEKIGDDGIGLCDQAFDFGCYHGFLGQAISEKKEPGFSSLKKFEDECKKRWGRAWLGCQHGIGHGILASLGEKNLVEALTLCEPPILEWLPFGGCPYGVFMEYNLRTMHNSSTLDFTYRPLDKSGPYAPCSWIPERFLESCYFAQPHWWERVFHGDYLKIGNLCNKIEEELLQVACFRGTGSYTAVNVKHSPREVIALCRKMPASDAVMFCLEGAALVLYMLPQWDEENIAKSLCNDVADNGYNFCAQQITRFVETLKSMYYSF